MPAAVPPFNLENQLSSPLGHFLTVMFILFAIVAVVSSISIAAWKDPCLSNAPAKINRLARAGMTGLLVQIGLGAFLKVFHAGLACPEFPLCADGFFPAPWSVGTFLAFSHRWWGFLMFGLFTHLALTTAKTCPELVRPARHAFALSIAQVFLGIGAVLGGLAENSRHLHLAAGYGLWGLLVYMALRTGSFRFLVRSNPERDARPV